MLIRRLARSVSLAFSEPPASCSTHEPGNATATITSPVTIRPCWCAAAPSTIARNPSGYASDSTDWLSVTSTHVVASHGAARHAVPNIAFIRRSARVSPSRVKAGILATVGPLGELRCLQREHLGIAPACRDQFVVAAPLGDAAPVEHRARAAPPHGGEAVRDHDGGQPGGQLKEAAVEGRLRPDIELGGGLIEHQYPRAARRRVQGTGERDPLPLTAGHVGAPGIAGGADGAPAVRQRADELQRPGLLRRLDQRRLVDIGTEIPEGRVLPRGQRVTGEVLVDDGDLTLPGPGVQVAYVGAVHGDPAAARIAEPGEQGHQRRLAGTVDPDQGKGLSRGQLQVQSVDDGPAARRRLGAAPPKTRLAGGAGPR